MKCLIDATRSAVDYVRRLNASYELREHTRPIWTGAEGGPTIARALGQNFSTISTDLIRPYFRIGASPLALALTRWRCAGIHLRHRFLDKSFLIGTTVINRYHK